MILTSAELEVACSQVRQVVEDEYLITTGNYVSSYVDLVNSKLGLEYDVHRGVALYYNCDVASLLEVCYTGKSGYPDAHPDTIIRVAKRLGLQLTESQRKVLDTEISNSMIQQLGSRLTTIFRYEALRLYKLRHVDDQDLQNIPIQDMPISDELNIAEVLSLLYNTQIDLIRNILRYKYIDFGIPHLELCNRLIGMQDLLVKYGLNQMEIT